GGTAGSRGRIGRPGTIVMTLSRALALAWVLAVVPLWPAAAQFGGMPGMPGSPGMSPAPGMSPGMPGMPGGAFREPQATPPAWHQLLGNRYEVTKHGKALQAAGKKKAAPEELCKLFKVFLSAEDKMLKGLEEHSATCGVPAEVLKQVKAGHSKASQMG